jgi:hypothetical protein
MPRALHLLQIAFIVAGFVAFATSVDVNGKTEDEVVLDKLAKLLSPVSLSCPVLDIPSMSTQPGFLSPGSDSM